jgi:hypothetical protein
MMMIIVLMMMMMIADDDQTHHDPKVKAKRSKEENHVRSMIDTTTTATRVRLTRFLVDRAARDTDD